MGPIFFGWSSCKKFILSGSFNLMCFIVWAVDPNQYCKARSLSTSLSYLPVMCLAWFKDYEPNLFKGWDKT